MWLFGDHYDVAFKLFNLSWRTYVGGELGWNKPGLFRFVSKQICSQTSDSIVSNLCTVNDGSPVWS